MVEYDVGFKASGEITALKIRGYFLCGAFLDLGFNDMMVLQQGRRPGAALHCTLCVTLFVFPAGRVVPGLSGGHDLTQLP